MEITGPKRIKGYEYEQVFEMRRALMYHEVGTPMRSAREVDDILNEYMEILFNEKV